MLSFEEWIIWRNRQNEFVGEYMNFYKQIPSCIDGNFIDAFYKRIDKIKSQKNWLERFRNHKKIYEIYNWDSYECIIK